LLSEDIKISTTKSAAMGHLAEGQFLKGGVSGNKGSFRDKGE
jgi:hypothetical protein